MSSSSAHTQTSGGTSIPWRFNTSTELESYETPAHTLTSLWTHNAYNTTENIIKTLHLRVANSIALRHTQTQLNSQNTFATLPRVHSGTLNTTAWGQQRANTHYKHLHTEHLQRGLGNACACPPASSLAWRFCCPGNTGASVRSCESSDIILQKSVKIWPLSPNEAQSKSHGFLHILHWCCQISNHLNCFINNNFFTFLHIWCSEAGGCCFRGPGRAIICLDAIYYNLFFQYPSSMCKEISSFLSYFLQSCRRFKQKQTKVPLG